MAKGRRTNYKQMKTGTVSMGTTGDQIHIAEVRMIDDALRGAFLNNIQFSVQDNHDIVDRGTLSAFTLYLSYESSSWNDHGVIAVSATGVGGGNGNLTAKRYIKTNETGSTIAEQLGPVHVWAECSDTSALGTNKEMRVTLTCWGRMILLVEDF